MKPVCVIALTVAVAAIASCQTQSGSSTREARERSIEATSSVPVTVEPTVLPRDTPILRPLKRVDTGGQCGPRYLHGGLGTCVNNQPCRGFGVEDEKGQVLCSCYGDIGGCGAGQRCDDRKLTCVLDEEPPFNKTP